MYGTLYGMPRPAPSPLIPFRFIILVLSGVNEYEAHLLYIVGIGRFPDGIHVGPEHSTGFEVGLPRLQCHLHRSDGDVSWQLHEAHRLHGRLQDLFFHYFLLPDNGLRYARR